MNYYIITFESTNLSIEAEKKFKKEALDFTIVPTPRVISDSCGLSIRILNKTIDDIFYYIKNQSIKYNKIYLIENNEIIKEFN